MQVAFAKEIVQEHLENAARAVLAECKSVNPVASARDRQHMRGLLQAISACIGALGCALPGLQPEIQPPSSSQSLAVIGQVCPRRQWLCPRCII